MVNIHIEDGVATFTIAGLHKLWALKSRIVVPVQNIVAVDGPEAAPRWAGWRVAGTWMPGLITAGTFRQDAQWTFWDVAQPHATIVVTLRGHWYSRLIIEVARPDDARQLLTAGDGALPRIAIRSRDGCAEQRTLRRDEPLVVVRPAAARALGPRMLGRADISGDRLRMEAGRSSVRPSIAIADAATRGRRLSFSALADADSRRSMRFLERSAGTRVRQAPCSIAERP